MKYFVRPKKIIGDDSVMSFFGHVDILRKILIRIVAVVITIAIICFIFNSFIIDGILLGPKTASFPTNKLFAYLADMFHSNNLLINNKAVTLINTQMSGQVNLSIYISFVTAIIVAIPYILWELWQFVKPALSEEMIKKSNLFLLYTSICFLIGILFGYFIISPLTVNFLTTYIASNQITNLIDINSYFSTVLLVSLSSGLVFLLPLIAYFLSKMRIINAGIMRHYRRHAILILTIIAAIITPPDIISCILVLIPMLGLYELSVYISLKVGKKNIKH